MEQAYHVIRAWLAEKKMTLGEIKTEEKSNEITAVPELSDMIDEKEALLPLAQ